MVKNIKRGFFKLLKDSWDEYRINFPAILIIFILLSVIPALILAYVKIPAINFSLDETIAFLQTNKGILYQTLYLASMFISALMSSSLIILAFSKKVNWKSAISSGSNFWGKYILLSIILVLLLIIPLIPLVLGLYIYTNLLIYLSILSLILYIPGIIFSLYFIFSYYALISEKKSIIESMKSSFNIIKGKWWKTLGLLILLFIALAIISSLFSAIGSLINKLSGQVSYIENIVNAQTIKQQVLTTAGFFITLIFSLAASLIAIPLKIFFLKNFYQDMKNKD